MSFLLEDTGVGYYKENRREQDSFKGVVYLLRMVKGCTCSTQLALFLRSTMTVVCYRDEILQPYERLFQETINPNFLLINDSSNPHRVSTINDSLQSEETRRMGWLAR
ncbi:hypothetical protein NPIL_604891 [Nephila pilipes]|uniref:Uncharacterized protein n=1 Tax=Nephila pilipes TaxID=299642 RepID=A0A8X6R285_NEPPI|nr:hypothetical protein NPIL_604891 [Nephila pilipes]